MINREFYAQGFQKLIYQPLFTKQDFNATQAHHPHLK